MTELTPAQQRILKAASEKPEVDIRHYMTHIRNPVIQDKLLTALLTRGLITQDDEEVAFLISAKGMAVFGKQLPAEPILATTSKQQVVIDMLSREEGATLAQMQEATGWQQHTVRGMISAILKKKLGLDIVSSKRNGERVYKINATR